MNEDRFRELAEAYGGDLARWPRVAGAHGADFVAANGPAAARILERASQLDAALGAWTAREPRVDLRVAVIAAAPAPREARGPLNWLVGAGVGLGLAACCAAGVATGLTLVPGDVVGAIAGGSGEAADDIAGLLAPTSEGGGV